MDAFGNVAFSGTAKTLLARLSCGDLTEPQFLQECAYWAVKDGFDELRVKSYPTMPNTQAFREYENLPPQSRLKVDGRFFLQNPEIINYYTQRNFVRHMNKATYDWLKEIRRNLPDTDIITKEKIDARLREFTLWLNDENETVEKVKAIFAGEER